MSSGTPVIPTTPTNSASLLLIGASPAMLTPSKLPHFLKHAELHLGVPNATMYEESLQVWGYRPDVLHLETDASLASLGISEGDVLQLKKGCVRWWNSCDAKHKHCDSDDILTQSNNCTPPNKKVHFETRFAEGGSHTFFGPHMIKADPDGPEPEDVDDTQPRKATKTADEATNDIYDKSEEGCEMFRMFVVQPMGR
ncbi:hypothetical protein L208DRAFT_1292304 [Tricholoma matsutake]|nr:hypothetical protein L208DRAFT_1292304 [Tricholoma matsutake 945]